MPDILLFHAACLLAIILQPDYGSPELEAEAGVHRAVM